MSLLHLRRLEKYLLHFQFFAKQDYHTHFFVLVWAFLDGEASDLRQEKANATSEQYQFC